MPSNPDFEPIDVEQEDASVIGKVVGLLRDYQGPRSSFGGMGL